MKNKFYILPVLFAIMLIIAGCGGGGGSNNPSHPEIEQMLGYFEHAIEVYNVTGMLNCLSDTGVQQLTIKEAGLSYDKDKITLATELNADKTNQLAWRKSNTEDPNGHGYVLDLVLGTPSYSNETTTGAVVTQSFAVYESATSPLISRMKTDNGNIIWQVAEINGEWKATMTIEYRTLSGAALSVTGTEKRSGLGFTTFGTRFK